VIGGLRRLEYRGYDSAGVAVMDGHGGMGVVKSAGVLANLEACLGSAPEALSGCPESDTLAGSYSDRGEGWW